jgi:hypothetical protein
MDRIAYSYDQALYRLAIYCLTNKQAKAIMAGCPIAARFNGAPYYYPADIDKAADKYLASITIDHIGGE